MSDISKIFRCLKFKKLKWLLKREPVVNVDPPDHSDNRGPSSVETTKPETDILLIQAIIEDLPCGLTNTNKREEDIAAQSIFEWSDSDIPEFPDCSPCCCEDVDDVKTTVCSSLSSHRVCLDCAVRFAEEGVNIKAK